MTCVLTVALDFEVAMTLVLQSAALAPDFEVAMTMCFQLAAMARESEVALTCNLEMTFHCPEPSDLSDPCCFPCEEGSGGVGEKQLFHSPVTLCASICWSSRWS